MYRHLLVATDGSELAQNALEQGVALAKALDAKVTIVTVTEPWHVYSAGDGTVIFPIEEYEANINKKEKSSAAKSE